jgi:hypothetical protein
MEFSDFLQEFDSLFFCRLFKTSSEGGSWHKVTISGEWSRHGNSDQGYADTVHAPQVQIRLDRPSEVFATLTLDHSVDLRGAEEGQCADDDDANNDDDSNTNQPPNIALFMLKSPKNNVRSGMANNTMIEDPSWVKHKRRMDGSRISILGNVMGKFDPLTCISSRDLVAKSGKFTNLPTVSLNTKIVDMNENGCFTFVATTYKPVTEKCTFTITLFCDYPFEVI